MNSSISIEQTAPAHLAGGFHGALPASFEPTCRSWFVSQALAWLLVRYHRPEIEGLSGLPANRALIYVAKHPHTRLYGETVLLAVMVARARLAPIRRFDPGPGLEPADHPPLRWPAPLARAAPQREALDILRGGGSLLVYPGGARERRGPPDVLQWRARRGYAHLAVRSGAPVVPFVIEGADQQHPFRLPLEGGRVAFLPPLPLPVKLRFRLGAPMDPPPRGASSLAVATFSEEVAHATRLLLSRVRRRRS